MVRSLLSHQQQLLDVCCEELCSNGNKDDAEELAENNDELLAQAVLELACEGNDELDDNDVCQYRKYDVRSCIL